MHEKSTHERVLIDAENTLFELSNFDTPSDTLAENDTEHHDLEMSSFSIGLSR